MVKNKKQDRPLSGTLLKPERTQNPERSQNVLQLRSGFSTERS